MRTKRFYKILPLLLIMVLLIQTTGVSAAVSNSSSYVNAQSSTASKASGYTGMQKVDGKWMYMVNGKVDTSYTGLVNYNSKWVYVVKGELNTTYTGLVKYKTNWVYVNKGKLDASYTGLVNYKSSWVYVNKGKLDISYTGMVKYKNDWVYVTKGKLDTAYTGLARNKYGWWHMTNGKLDLTYFGFSKNQSGTWYVTGGKINTDVSGIVKNNGSKWYVVDGMIDTSYNGKIQLGKMVYTIKAGKVISEVDKTSCAELKIWCSAEDQDSGWIQKMCDEFSALHPEWDITYKFETCSEGDAGKMVTRDPEAAADIFFFASDQLNDLLASEAIDQLSGSALEYVKETNSENMLKTVTNGGNVYGFPFTANTWFMYYDKRVFTEDDVKSLDTMLSKAKVAFPLTNSWYFQAFYAAVGGVFCGANGDDEAAGIVLGDKATAVTKYLVDLVNHRNFIDDTNYSGYYYLREGEAGAIFSGTWDYQNVVAAIGEENVGICQPPTIKVEGKDYSLRAFMGSKAVGVNSYSESKDIAMALAQYLSSEEAQLAHYEMRNIIPCNTKLLATETLKKDALAQAQANTVVNASIIQPINNRFNSNWWSNASTFAYMILDGTVTEENAAETTKEFEDAINEEY